MAFTDIYAGQYFPCISLYKNAVVKVNFGPRFDSPPRDVPFLPVSPSISIWHRYEERKAWGFGSCFADERAGPRELRGSHHVRQSVQPVRSAESRRHQGLQSASFRRPSWISLTSRPHSCVCRMKLLRFLLFFIHHDNPQLLINFFPQNNFF